MVKHNKKAAVLGMRISRRKFANAVAATALVIAFALPYVAGASATELDNPLGQTNIQVIIGYAIKAIFGLVGSIALAMFIYGGFLWMTSEGTSERIKKGKDTMVWAAIGLGTIFAAYAIVGFIIDRLAGASTATL
ncbi:MAG: pilin [Candidatus Uhrbacteria bacterium]